MRVHLVSGCNHVSSANTAEVYCVGLLCMSVLVSPVPRSKKSERANSSQSVDFITIRSNIQGQINTENNPWMCIQKEYLHIQTRTWCVEDQHFCILKANDIHYVAFEGIEEYTYSKNLNTKQTYETTIYTLRENV